MNNSKRTWVQPMLNLEEITATEGKSLGASSETILLGS